MVIDVTDVPDRERFEARDSDADGALAGLMTYQLTGKVIAVTHVEITPEYADRGVEETLTRAVMNDARQRARVVVPIYPPLADWLGKHPEYNSIVAGATKKLK
ncbi:GNAT family N-acetyltransferase [Micromonospora pattaloongensis]|nr:GNAT family N-acetyltransferase [Micromonospora pattaloongensis]